jgi:glycosyltransferase involved in cell wall biosynthesis
LARELARRGHAVTYLEIEKSRTRPGGDNPRVLNFEDAGWDELNLVRAWYGFAYNAPENADTRLLEQLAPVGKGGVVVCSAPFRPALGYLPALAARGYAMVYDVLDDISAMRALGAYCYDDAAERYLAEQSDLIVTLSPRLCAKFSARENVTLIRDGVDLTPFRAGARAGGESDGAARLKRGELTLGFWGTMWDYNLDVPLLQELFRARPAWEFHLIGAHDLDPARPPLRRALNAPNAHLHDSVPRARLADYARAFDVCILPTPVTPFNLARDPLKVYEYLACHKPVVATALEQLAEMPYVYRAQDANDFLRRTEEAARVKPDPATLDAYLEQQTWDKRAGALMEALARLPQRARSLPPPPQGAMPGAAEEPDRGQAFARHLERMVQDREAHVRALETALDRSRWTDKLKRALGSE